MGLRIGNVTFDCGDVLRVATFWSGALGRPLDPSASAGFASIGNGDPDRAEPAWYFERVPEGKTAKNRMHLDFFDPDPDAVERLVGLGASVVDGHELSGHHWTVMQDPEGNEFCVSARAFEG